MHCNKLSDSSCAARLKKNASVATKSASARIWANIAKAASMSRMVRAFRIVISCPTLRAAVFGFANTSLASESYSIISLICASSVGGAVRPSA